MKVEKNQESQKNSFITKKWVVIFLIVLLLGCVNGIVTTELLLKMIV